jgi:hypothetical protein
MSFGPISLLVPRFKSSTTNKVACGLKFGPAAILNQNLIFQMASNLSFRKSVMKNLVFCFAAQQGIDLVLNLLALVALYPPFPVIR